MNLPPPDHTISANTWIFGVCRENPINNQKIFVARHSTYHVYNPRIAGPFMEQKGDPAQYAREILGMMMSALLERDECNLLKVPYAPRSWSFADRNLAAEISRECSKLGLPLVGVCSEEEYAILNKGRQAKLPVEIPSFRPRPFDSSVISLGDNSKCHGCGLRPGCSFQPVIVCHCRLAFYHSQDCMDKHWEHHRDASPLCQDALALMKSLGLEFSRSKESVRVVVYRLIFTGQDTPENWELLFGSDGGLRLSLLCTRKTYQTARISLLLEPPPGSKTYRQDIKCMEKASLNKKIRPANVEESSVIRKIRGVQTLIEIFARKGSKTTPPWLAAQDYINGPRARQEKGKLEDTDSVPIFHLAMDTMELPAGGSSVV
ncbi:hypothetical protein QBC39DRAFT_429862 [Podospora conica]|nr:hypothetical protein QBC39DRAFT_429862 [Schizothecium conicum]